MKELQKRPTEEEFGRAGRLDEYSTGIFIGRRIIEVPEKYGDYTHIKYLDPSVKDKIDPSKKYKCWYHHRQPADPADCSDYYFIAYIEEVPEHYLWIEREYEKYQKYIKEK